MSYNPLSQSNFNHANTCLPCCEQPVPGECACALLIPPFGEPYADYATAEAAITDSAVDCYGYLSLVTGTLDSASVTTATANEVNVDAQATDDVQAGVDMDVCVTVEAGSTLSVAYSVTSTGASTDDTETIAAVVVKDCAGTLVYDDQDSIIGTGTVSGTFSFGPFATRGVYYVTVGGVGASVDDPTQTTTIGFDLTNDSAMVPNPVIALWDDSGTTRQLEACPRMLLPPMTESSGDWYADEAEAQAAIDDYTRGCVAYFSQLVSPGPVIGTYSASDGGSSFDFSVDLMMDGAPPGYAVSTGDVYGSVNAEAGETLTMSWSGDPLDTPNAVLFVYDYDGNYVTDTGASATSPVTTSSLPYTGRYILVAYIGNRNDALNVSGSVTSSGALSVTPIQALYATDPLLDCPARIDCE